MVRNFCVVFVLGLAVAACGGGSNSTHACGDGHVDTGEECDDGNTNPNDGCSALCKIETSVCGDGVTDVATEQCDDGNTVSGDGCSANCQRETVAPVLCGNGMLDSGEACDDFNVIAGDGCSATCTVEDGYVCTGTPSVCMIPPHATGGTCAAPEAIALTGTTTLTGMVMGDTTIGTSMVPDTQCLGYETGDGNDNIWSFTITQPLDVVVNLDSDFDGAIFVQSTACDTATNVTTAGNTFGCVDQTSLATESMKFTSLAAGTYYVVVDSFLDDEYGPYTLTITATPDMCGGGTLEGAESCDDGNTAAGDGCDPHCYIEGGWVCTAASPSVCTHACGNGTIESAANEDCDDGNTTNGDGCSSTCQTEPGWDCGFDEPSECVLTCGNGFLDGAEECDPGATTSTHCTATCTLNFDVTEVEPNNTAATAQHLNAVAHQIIKGSLATDDVDLYTFTLTAPHTVEIETYDTVEAEFTPSDTVSTLTDLQCYQNDTILRIFASTADPLDDTAAMIYDDEDGSFSCSYIGPSDSDDVNVEGGADIADNHQGMLPAGTYTLKVTDYFGDSQDHYLIDLRIE